VDVSPKVQGRGTARQLMGNLMDVLEQGVEANPLTITATDVGSYTWARMGFAADPDQWPLMQKQVLKNFKRVRSLLPEREQDSIFALLSDKHPESVRDLVWAIADASHPLTYQGRQTTLGKELLVGVEWKGALDRHDPDAMERFNAYTLRQRDVARPWEPSGRAAKEGIAL
jgi:hypothetical protein